MSLFEWFGESYFPGEMGSIKKRRYENRDVPRYLVLLNSLISVGIIAGFYYLVSYRSEGISLQTCLIISAVFVVYCIIAFFVNPKPDYKNIGIGRTPINHPFRISDDINRFLIIMKAMLWPGFYIVRSLIEFIILIKHSDSRDMR
ncbi:MAG: hypothetical protein QNK33_09850 [Bacteroidales bacterium]|nr:hypothetical protein [Bacteroidales bacterium]